VAESREGAPADAGPVSAVSATPTRLSTAVVLLATMVTATLVIAQIGPTLAALVAVFHAVVFAGSLWLVGRERWRPVAMAVAGICSLFVGASFAVAVGYTFLDAVATLYPVTDVAQIRPRGLRVASTTVAVLAGTVAMVGGVSTPATGLRGDSAWEYAKLAVETFVVPLLVAALMLLSTLLAEFGGPSEVPVLGQLANATGGVGDVLLSPAPGRTHLLVFTVLVAIAPLAVGRGIESLPLSELATAETHERVAERAEAVASVARRVALVAAALLPVTLVEVVVRPLPLRNLLTPPLYGLLAWLTGNPLLRSLLVGTIVVAGGTAVSVWVVRWLVRTDASSVAVSLTPFVGGASVVLLASVLHGVVLQPTRSFVTAALPGEFATAFARQSAAIVEFYGSLAVVVTVAAMLVGMTAVLALSLALVTRVDLLPTSAPAPALAAAGTFLAAAFGAGAGVPAPFVLGGIVTSLVVWDAGEYGATLGREMGAATGGARTEGVHVGATLVVGLAGALLATAVSRIGTADVLTGVPTVPFALAAVVVALVLLILALR